MHQVSSRRPRRAVGCSIARMAGRGGQAMLVVAVAGCSGLPQEGGMVGADGSFALAPQVAQTVAQLPGLQAAAPAWRLRAYALRMHTSGGAAPVDVLGRLAWMPDGTLAAVTSSAGAGAHAFSRSIGLCGLVSLRLDAARGTQPHLPADPARTAMAAFTDESHLEPAERMQVASLHVEGEPCDPRPGGEFELRMRIHATGAAAAGEVRYACRSAAALEPAARLHARLPGAMLRVDCRRHAASRAAEGELSYAWIADARMYLLTGHRSSGVVQRYAYTAFAPAPPAGTASTTSAGPAPSRR